MKNDRRALGVLTLLLLIAALPFVGRAYFVDDYYFVTMAKGILEHPLRPYDFVSDDAGSSNISRERPEQPPKVNPPLFHYFLAAVIKVWGDAVWKLRTASLLFSLISLYAVYFLGKRFVRNPLPAAALLAVTPAFWLTSYSLLIDSAMLAFFLASLVCFIEGQERHRWRWLIASGVLMGCTLMTKYTGALIVPVVLLWHLLNRKSCSWKGTTAALGVCAALFLAWGVWGILTYGQMHIIATFTRGFHSAVPIGALALGLAIVGLVLYWWAEDRRAVRIAAWTCGVACSVLVVLSIPQGASFQSWLGTFYLDKGISLLSFLGGSTVFLFLAPILLGARHQKALGVLGVFVVLLFLCFSSRVGGFDRGQSALLAFFIGSALSFLVLTFFEISPKADRGRLFLLGWLTWGLLELIVVMPWTAARYLLIVLPPLCWLFQHFTEAFQRPRLLKLAWGATALMGGALAYVDYAQAGVIVPLSQVLQSQKPLFQAMAPRPLNHWFYLADTFDGSQPYVLQEGWENVFPNQKFTSGSLFLRSVFRKSSWWTISNPEQFQPVMVWEYTSWVPLRVMDVPASAGFYASVWGILPYAITRHPLERFELYRVK
jgi:4-amino-4-deoxy-L-arabinose transferase-like glycosyltransferase